MAQIQKERDIVLYHSEDHYCGPGPSAVQLGDGAILVAFRRAYNWGKHGIYAHGYPSTEACLIRSKDGGATWSTPRTFTAGFITNQNLTRLPDGALICITQRGEVVPLQIYEEHKATKLMRRDPHFGFVSASQGVQALRSTDDGRTWEGPYFLSPIPDAEPVFPGWPSPAGLRSSAIVLNDGSVGVAVYGHITADRNATNVWFMVSDDGGVTWQPRGRIAHDPDGEYYYNETNVYQCASGKLVAFMRVELDPEKSLYTSVSTDEGRTWTAPKREGVQGYPYQAARLASGSVLLAYGYRYEPLGLRARLLDPECEDIVGAEELVLRADGGITDLGYPHVLPLPNGTAMVTYYHNVTGGTRHIAASIVSEK